MKKKIINKSSSPVDVYNDYEMVSLGIRKPVFTPRDPLVWTKTPKEKKALKKLRNKKYPFARGFPKDSKAIPVKSKLIITIKKNNKFKFIDDNKNIQYKTTFSYVCYQSEIPKILSFFTAYNKDFGMESLVIKYYWNGKEYSPDVLPYWRW